MHALEAPALVKFGVVISLEELGYSRVRLIAQECERLGFDSLWVWDHFFFGRKPYLESWTTLSALASETDRLRLGTLVTCNSYRHPALLAKTAATLDVISNGRVELGIGAGWHRREYEGYGYAFPRAATRIGQLRESIQIIKRMWSDERPSYEGRYYAVRGAVYSPKPVQRPRPRIWVGGAGEKLLLKVAAEEADCCNFGYLASTPQAYARKIRVLDQHCARIGRDPGEIVMSFTSITVVEEDEGRVRESVKRSLKELSGSQSFWSYLPTVLGNPGLVASAVRFLIGSGKPSFILAGTPDECIDRLRELTELGASYFILHFPGLGGDLRSLELFAEEVMPEVAS